jgi:hypothetical protein
MTEPIEICGAVVQPGERRTVELPVARLYTDTHLGMPVHVVHGRAAGPVLFVSAAIHGDEINGVEIVHRLMHHRRIRALKGTLVAIPVVNVFGFLAQSRYLPDRRDLNRSFPGMEKGSLASRLAHKFTTEILERCDYGIDLHTGAVERTNLPQIRTRIDDAECLRMARAFRAPLILDAELRDGSMRKYAHSIDIPVIVFEAGEALRFSEISIRAGVRGVLRVMEELGMITPRRKAKKKPEPVLSTSSYWLRAPAGGIFRGTIELGTWVREGDVLGKVSDPLGEEEMPVIAPREGIVIGATTSPLVNEGDALLHLAQPHKPGDASDRIQELVPDATDAPDLGRMPQG